MTQIIKINPNNINKESISIASEALKCGGTVVFPTETVYGLGANALDAHAVSKIFKAKGRPSDNPLIVHIFDELQAKELSSEIPEVFYTLSKNFWPGPLTMIVKKSDKIPDTVSAGLNTVGLRLPSHPIALELLKQSGVPVAAPSANLSGSPSSTKAEHVISDLTGRVDVIIDGGDSEVGVESTVLDISGQTPIILRPGGVTKEQLEKVIGDVIVDKHIYEKYSGKEAPKSPGVKYKHYSPIAQVLLVTGKVEDIIKEVNRQLEFLISQGKKVGVMATEQTKEHYKNGIIASMGDRNNPETIAASCFSILRHFDSQKVDIIIAEGLDMNGIGMAYMNRMVRAAGYNVIEGVNK